MPSKVNQGLPCAVAIPRELQRQLRPASHEQHLVGGLHVLFEERQNVVVREGTYLLVGHAIHQHDEKSETAPEKVFRL